MLGLVSLIIPSFVSCALPSDPTTHRLPVFAWNAACQPPLDNRVMLGLEISLIIPSFVSPRLSVPTTHRLPVFAWKATW